MKKIIVAIIILHLFITGSTKADLVVGSKGNDVINLQNRLIELGFLSGTADGIYGDKTKAAVEAFQDSNGLAITGLLTETEIDLLYSEYIMDANGNQVDVAFQFAVDAEERDYDDQYLIKGHELYELGDYQGAFKQFQLAANYGQSDAQMMIGYMYQMGDGVIQDYKKALEYYNLAMEQGDEMAMNNIGTLYEHGLGVEQSYEEALRYYLMASDRNNASAQFNIGNLYFDGLGVEQSYEEALRYYRMAAEKTTVLH